MPAVSFRILLHWRLPETYTLQYWLVCATKVKCIQCLLCCNPCAGKFYVNTGICQFEHVCCSFSSYVVIDFQVVYEVLAIVQVVVWFPITKEVFDAKNQTKFLNALARAVNTSDDMVEIVSILQSQRRYHHHHDRRNGESGSGTRLVVTADIATRSLSEAKIRASLLTPEALSKYLSLNQLPAASLQSVSILDLVSVQNSEKSISIQNGIGIGLALIAGAAIVLFWRRRQHNLQLINRRLIGAESGTLAEQSDLPLELRTKYAALKVLGCGAFGVVIDAWQLNNGHRVVQRAIKLVHARGRVFTQTEARRLEREVCFCCLVILSFLFSLNPWYHSKVVICIEIAHAHARAHTREWQASIMSRLRSPNVVGYVESGFSKHNDVFWLVMELLEAESLDLVLIKEGPMPELDVIRVSTLSRRPTRRVVWVFWHWNSPQHI
jgi:hypothetical protein